MGQFKSENPLFAIARTKHLYQYVSGDFEFLNDSEENKKTYKKLTIRLIIAKFLNMIFVFFIRR